jgi:hypothetical protein
MNNKDLVLYREHLNSSVVTKGKGWYCHARLALPLSCFSIPHVVSTNLIRFGIMILRLMLFILKLLLICCIVVIAAADVAMVCSCCCCCCCCYYDYRLVCEIFECYYFNCRLSEAPFDLGISLIFRYFSANANSLSY